MKRVVAPVLPFAVAFVALSTRAQPGSTGALPPTEPSAQPTTSATTQPAPPMTAAPPTAPTATAQPQAQQPPPAYPPPGYPPGYGYGYGPPQPAPPPPPPKERPKRSVSLTFSPIHLLLPVFEANIEVRAVDHFGIAAIGGYGSVPAEDSTGNTDRFKAYELGGQLLGYPMEPFDKLVLGAEFLYVHVSDENIDNQNIRGVGAGYAIGPLAGYKIITDGGFTFVVHAGVEYVFIQAEASNETSSAQDEESRWIPLLNLNIGWSF